MKSNAEQKIFGLAEFHEQNSLCRNISAHKRPHNADATHLVLLLLFKSKQSKGKKRKEMNIFTHKLLRDIQLSLTFKERNESGLYKESVRTAL
jgi:hypothetical protein